MINGRHALLSRRIMVGLNFANNEIKKFAKMLSHKSIIYSH